MPGTHVYDPMTDPSDPAWCGGGETDGCLPLWRRARVYWALNLVLAPFFVVLLVTSNWHAFVAHDSTEDGRSADRVVFVGNASRLTTGDARHVHTAPSSTRLATAANEAPWVGARSAADIVQHMSFSPAAAPLPLPVSGDVAGLEPMLRASLEQLAINTHTHLTVVSGKRDTAQQARLYRAYRNGSGNLAAPPGTSHHETGQAADVYVRGVALESVSGASSTAHALGLGFPVSGEPWHVELVSVQ